MFNLLPLMMAFELTSSNVAAITFAVVAVFIGVRIALKMRKYTVTFIDSETKAVISEKKIRKNKKLKIEPAVKTGDTFMGWSFTPDGSKLCTDKSVVVAKDVALYAMWDKPIIREVIALEDANMYMEFSYADENGNIMKTDSMPLIANVPVKYMEYKKFAGWADENGELIVKRNYEGSAVAVTLYPVFDCEVGDIEKEEDEYTAPDSYNAEDANMYVEFNYIDHEGNKVTTNLMPVIASFPKSIVNTYGFAGWALKPDGDVVIDKDFEGSVLSFDLNPVGLEYVYGFKSAAAEEPVAEEETVEETYEEETVEEVVEEAVEETVEEAPVVEEAVEEVAEEIAEEITEVIVEEPVIESYSAVKAMPVEEEPVIEEEPVAVEETVEEAAEETAEEAPVVEETVEEAVEEAPVVEETVEETVEEAPVVEETVEETIEEAPVVEEAVEETVEEAPVVEEAVEEVVEEAPVVEEAVEETVEEAPVVEEAVEETVEEAPVVEEAAEEVVEEAAEEVVEEAPVVEEAAEEVVEEAPVVEEAVEEVVEEAPVAVEETVEETVEEAPVVEEAVEETVEEAPVVEEAAKEVVEEAPVVEEVSAEPVAPTIVPTYFDNEGNHIDIKYSRSFISNIIQGEELIKEYYSDLKNHILSYEGVKSRLSWKFDSYNRGRDQLFKIKVRGKTICIYLALDPDNYEVSKYHHEAIDAKIFEDVPMLFKIKSGLGLRKAKKLVDDTMEKFGIAKLEKPKFVDYVKKYPYTETEELVQQKLVKVLVSDSSVTVKSAKKAKAIDVDEVDIVEAPIVEEEAIVEAPVVEEVVVEEAPVVEEAIEEVAEAAPVTEEPVEEDIVTEEGIHLVKSVSADVADSLVEDEVVDKTVVEEIEYVSKNDTKKDIINVGVLSDAYEAGEVVDLASLKAKGLIDQKTKYVKVLASGIIDKPLIVRAQEFSETAIKMIVLTGGKVVKVTTMVK